MPDITLTGSNLIDGTLSARGSERLHVRARDDGRVLEPGFVLATQEELGQAAEAAARAFVPYSSLPAERRAEFLEAIAKAIEELGDALVQRANAESGLPLARLTGERGRTCGQLRMFANLVREGSWVDARIDTADANRTPPKPDIRRMLVPLGPVAVFGASNFPLAFSVAGGDTASALAAGCPVVFKAHPAHPGTCELVALAIAAAAESTGMPAGVFGMVHGDSSVGRALVEHPSIEAVAFTGSKRVGRTLFDLAASRERPIPVFAEMGSVNPLFVLPGALAERGEAIGRGYADSLTLGVGQFCTNPGVIVGIDSDGFDLLLSSAAARLAETAPGLMLTDTICETFVKGRRKWESHASLQPIFAGSDVEGRATPALFATTARDFLAHPELGDELFGPAAIAVRCETVEELYRVADALNGQLTATIHFADSDREEAARLLPALARIAGRVLVDGYPTGVEVCSAMQHGGPYPATTDSRSTSVGTASILRFARPVAYQSVPDDLLPSELQAANPRSIWRTVDGRLTNGG